jgi:hypothetical protein
MAMPHGRPGWRGVVPERQEQAVVTLVPVQPGDDVIGELAVSRHASGTLVLVRITVSGGA